jgi:hypothetical protein
MALPALALASGTAMSPVVSAKLAGKSEVPKGDPDGSGIAIFHLSTTKRTVCWSFDNLKRIGPPVVSHIHKGRVGAAGPVVVPLGAQYKPKGCVAAAKPVIEAIETHPNAYYVNIHDAKYPNGAIRGQLAAGMLGR